MKESRRINKAEFDMLIDNYRMRYGVEDRQNTIEYLFSMDGFKEVDELPRIL